MKILTTGTSPGTIFSCPFHQHDAWEIVLNTRGEGITSIGTEEHPFLPGSIFCIPPHTPHRKQSEEGFADIFFFTEDPPFTSGKYLAVNDDAVHTFEKLLELYLAEAWQSRPRSLRILEHLADSLALFLADSLEPLPDPQVEYLRSRISSSFRDPLFDVSTLFAECYYSEDYMRRLFRRETGMTPLQYLLDCRIRHACELLAQNHLLKFSIAEIAEMCGFLDIHYFSRTFRKHMHVSPLQYYQNYVSSMPEGPSPAVEQKQE